MIDTPTPPTPLTPAAPAGAGAPRPVRSEPVALRDAWPWARPFRLDGALERGGFAPIWTALLVFILAWILFQVIGGVVVAAGIIAQAAGSGEPPDMGEVASLIENSPRLFLGGNALGQALAFGGLAWLAARLSTTGVGDFLRLRRPDGVGLGLAGLGWAALYPVVLWTGEMNAKLPVPPWMESLDEMRTEMLEGLLLQSDLSTAFLFLTVALTPAVFEELLFRGYLQRQTERRFGSLTSILAVGVFFGLYHLSPTQALPLSILGVYLGFVVWATGSLWTGVLVHLLNNGLAVLVAGAARNTPGADLESVGDLGIPTWAAVVLVLGGAAIVTAVVARLRQRRETLTGGRPDAAPVPSPELTLVSPS